MEIIRSSLPERHYGMNEKKFAQLFFAGIVATCIMTALGWLCRVMGIEAPDFAAVFGAILYGGVYPLPLSGLWWLGLVWHVVNGSLILSLLFDYLSDRQILVQRRWTRGSLWALCIWAGYEIVIQPLAGEGFFASQMVHPVSYSILNLFLWVVYGLVLDGMTRVRMVHGLHLGERRAA